MTIKKLTFEVEKAEILEQPHNSQFATARIQAFHTGQSRNKTWCDLEALQRTASSIYEKPIIFELNPVLGDFGTHSGVTVPAGFVVPDSAVFEELPDGRTALTVFAKIWKKYCGKFLEIFQQTDTEEKSVSVEMEVMEYEELEGGILNLINFAYSAICVLGDFVTEASPNAHLNMLSFAKKEGNEYEKAKKLEFSKYADIDFTIPAWMKKQAKKALEEYDSSTMSVSGVTLAMARYIIKNEKMTPEKVRHMRKNLSREMGKKKDTLSFWGGTSSMKWSEEIVSKMDAADKVQLKYFYQENIDEEEMPDKYVGIDNYKAMEEINMAKKDDVVVEEKIEATMAEEKPEVKEEEPKEEAATPPDEMAEQNMHDDKFSFKGFADGERLMSLFADDEEVSKEMQAQMTAEFADGGKVFSAMFGRMCKMQEQMHQMSEDAKAYMAENEELKKFKADMEAKDKQFAVDATLTELAEKVIIPDDTLAEMRADAEKFTFAELEGWKNNCKAKAFSFAVKESRKDEKEEVKIGLPFNFGADYNAPVSIWDAKK